MRINHNIAALNTHRQLGAANNAQTKSMEKLSSGLRINSAADDAAGLAISEKMRAQVRGLDQASANSQDAISLIQTAEGALNETTSILQRMRELATQASTDTNTTSDRGEIQKEINSLTSEINRIGNTTEFNTQKLLNGEKDGGAGVSGVAGVTTLSIPTAVTSGQKISIDGVELTFTAAASGDAVETALATLIGGASGLSTKYSAAASSGVVTITQKSGQESATALTSSLGTVSTTTAGVAAKAAGTGASLNSKSVQMKAKV